MNVRNPDITGPCRHLKTGARIRAQHEHIKNLTTHPALTGEGGSAYNQDEPLNPDCSGFCLSGPRPIASTGGKPFSERLYLGYRRKFDLPTHMSRATIIFSGRGELGQAVVRRCQPQCVARLPWSAVATRSRCGAMANDTLVSISTSSWKVRYGCCALILRALLISGRRKW